MADEEEELRFPICTVQSLGTGVTCSSVVDRVGIDAGLPDYQLPEAPAEVIVVEKKCGRPPRNPVVVSAAKNRSKAVAAVEEDVCFICFDGGSLVLCDRRDCPKAYHPACVKREESFFCPDIRWDCGWHFCNICQKNALFMCYTCPHSLCKGCVKMADILCVRGNKGFCRTCMSTIMLIEKIPQENKELAQVDFDDTTCWEYLFKVYWTLLKEKESLTLDELIRASNPWKVSELKKIDKLQRKAHYAHVSNNGAHLEAHTSKRRKTRKQQQPLTMDSQKIDKAGSNKVSGLLGQPDWASKELLKFVAYVKNGDVSPVSEFDVQVLLLDYIKNNNLRDPHQKCQIICDKRLESLLGKERVGHFEMLKLLEYHFKEESSSNGMIHNAAANPLSGLLVEEITVDIQTPCKDNRQQSCRNGDEKSRRIDPAAYAAIDAHNINLIYLKRSMLETLTADAEKFHDKVVGSVVRIKISSNDQKQVMYRLVRIIGTSKATQPHKVGDKMENLILKVLNLNKVEDVTIAAISDQDFSEDECRRLRQSIKLGLVERMIVGEIREKAMALQAVGVSDSPETKITRLNHLRDRASEMGRRKELRELVEKIELLTHEERQRRIDRTPVVHADPRMDPSCGSDDDSGESDIKKRDGTLTPKYSKSYSKSMEVIPPRRMEDMSKDDQAMTLKAASANGERKRKYSGNCHVGKVEGVLGSMEPSQKTVRTDASSRVLEHDGRTNSSVISSNHVVATIGSVSQANSYPSKETAKEMLGVPGTSELEKIWHYQDPLGKIQGPFCMLQLRKWDSNGCFPDNLKVWRTLETSDRSILLNDALKKQQSSEPQFLLRSCLRSHDGDKIDNDKVYSIGVMNSNSITSRISDQTNEECSKSNMTDTASTPKAIEHSVNGYSSQFLKAQLIDSLFNVEEPNSDAIAERSPDMLHVDLKSEFSKPANAMPLSGNVDVVSQAVNSGPPSPDTDRPDSGTNLHIVSEGIAASNLPGPVPVSCKENTKDLHVDNEHHDKSGVCKDFSASCGTEAGGMKLFNILTSLPNTQIKDQNDCDTIEKHGTVYNHEQDSGVYSAVSNGTNVSVLPSAAQKMENGDVKCHDAENRHFVSLHVPGGDCGMDISLLPSTTPKNEEITANDVENKYYASSKVPEQDSGTSRSTISGSIMVSDVPCTTPKPGTDGLNTPITENKGTLAPNIPGQDTGTGWSNMPGGIDFSVIATAPLKVDVDSCVHVAVENNHCSPLHVEGQDFCFNWSDASRLAGEIQLPGVADEWDWQPIELNTLGDESVSDLLSEVEAMEVLKCMSSPSSRTNCADDLNGPPGNDCFSPLGGLNLNLDPGKNDDLSSPVSIQFHVHPNHSDQPHLSFQIDGGSAPYQQPGTSRNGPS